MPSFAFEMKIEEIHIRRLDKTDDIQKLTLLINTAYKQLADMGWNYTGSYQDAEETMKRNESGECYVAFFQNNIIGTILYFPPNTLDGCKIYQKNGMAVFGQFAVSPEYQRYGIGTSLIQYIEKIAKDNKVKSLALDTAEDAIHLISFYSKLGYKIEDFIQWERKTYRSVIMSKSLQS